MANGDDARACRSPAASYVSAVTVPRDSRPRLRPSCLPEGDEQGHVHVVDLVALDDGRAGRHRVVEPSPHVVEPVAVVDGGQDRRHPPGAGPGSRARGSRPGSGRSLGRLIRRSRGSSRRHPARRRSSGTSPGRHRGGRGPGRRPPRGRRRREPGIPATTMPTPTSDDRGRRSAPTRRTPSQDPGTDAGASPPVASRVANRPRSSAADPGSGTSRSTSGRTAHTTTRPPSRATLVPNSSVCGAIRSVLATATRRPNTTRPTRPAGTVFGSVIMKNRKISTSGEVTITRQ